MPRQITEHLFPRGLLAVMIAFAQYRPVARLVAGAREEEHAWLGHRVGEAAHRPTCQNIRQAGDILLGIAAIDTQRVQLENLAREILVEPPTAVAAGFAVGT